MDHRPLGRTGMQVSPLCLGAMMFGAWGEPDHEKSVAIVHRALDAGINFIDTADVYSQGESETIVGKALAGGRRDGLRTLANRRRAGSTASQVPPACRLRPPITPGNSPGHQAPGGCQGRARNSSRVEAIRTSCLAPGSRLRISVHIGSPA